MACLLLCTAADGFTHSDLKQLAKLRGLSQMVASSSVNIVSKFGKLYEEIFCNTAPGECIVECTADVTSPDKVPGGNAVHVTGYGVYTPDAHSMYDSQMSAATGRLMVVILLLVICSCFTQQVAASDAVVPPAKREQGKAPVRVVMSAAFVSESGIGVYEEIFRYLANKLDSKVEFISGFSYSTINSMLESGMADIGFVCGLPYVMMKDKPNPRVDLLLAPVMKNGRYKDKPVYYSYIIVQKDSKFKDFSTLRGSTFVYNDEISNSGYNMPRAHLIRIGEVSGFFGKTIRSGSHEESIRMVAQGKADVTAVDSLVYDYERQKSPKYVQKTRIIKVLGPAGIPPVVISTRTPLPVRKKIRDILIGMKNDPAGKKILDKALLDRFAVVEESNYISIREMNKLAHKSGYLVIR